MDGRPCGDLGSLARARPQEVLGVKLVEHAGEDLVGTAAGAAATGSLWPAVARMRAERGPEQPRFLHREGDVRQADPAQPFRR